MHISYEGGILEDPWVEAPPEIFILTRSPEAAPDEPQYIEVFFEAGVPIAVDGETLSPANLLDRVNRIGGKHGIGRIDLVENRFVGMKSRGVYETPGVTMLQSAHRAVESLTLDREVAHLKDGLNSRIAEMIYYGFWYTPEFEAIRALIDETQKNVTGTARLKLYKGNCSVVGRRSPCSLYSEAFATFEHDTVYNQRDAEGFIKLNALRLRMRKMAEKKIEDRE